MPTQLTQIHFIGGIARAVSLDLFFPKGAARFRHSKFRAMFMAMPEAAMNKDHGPVFRQDDVGATWQ